MNTHAIEISSAGASYRLFLISSSLPFAWSNLTNELSRLNSCPTRCILFLVMMQLDNFYIWEILSCLSCELHQQNSSQGKVWSNQSTQLLFSRQRDQLFQLLWSKTCCSNNWTKPLFQSEASIVISYFRGCKINPDMGFQSSQFFLCVENRNTCYFFFIRKRIQKSN